MHYNRAARDAWLSVSERSFSCSKAGATAALAYIFDDLHMGGSIRFPADKRKESQALEAAIELSLLSGEPDIAMDLRAFNGRPNNPGLDAFWNKSQELLQEFTRVDDRRHGVGLCPYMYVVYVVGLRLHWSL